MKRLFLLSCIIISAFQLVSAQENIRSRERIKDSKIEFIRIEPTKVEAKGMTLRAVHFDVYLRVINKTEGNAVIDKLDNGLVLLDNKKAATFTHGAFSVIEPEQSSEEKFNVRVPIVGALTAISRMPQNMTIKATAQLTLMLGKMKIETPFTYELSKTFKIPYDKITKMVTKKVKKISF